MSASYVHDTQFFTRRTAVLAVIIAAHVGLIWLLASGLAQRAIQLAAPPIKTTIVQQHIKHIKPPPPPPPQMQQQIVQVPPPAIQINVPAAQETRAITVVRHARPAPPPPPVHYTYTPARAGSGFPSTDNYYPQASQRLGEEGTAYVHLCIGPQGQVAGSPSIVKSSGSPRLDRAALRYARATSGHWIPEKRNGQPITICTQLPIKFQLNDF